MNTFSWRIYQFALRTSPVTTFFIASTLGFILLGASYFLGIDLVQLKLPTEINDVTFKEVGFLWAPNWSFTAVVLTPLLLTYTHKSLKDTRKLLEDLQDRRMISSVTSGNCQDKCDVEALLNRKVDRALKVGGIVFILIFTSCLFLFFMESGQLYSESDLLEITTLTHSVVEYDWSVAALLPGGSETVSPTSNYIFTMCSYVLVPCIGGGCILGFYGFSFWLIMSLLPTKKQQLVLLPDPSSSDTRRGFEVFASLLKNSFIITALSFVPLYAANIQNYYLRSASHAHIKDFVIPSFTQGFNAFRAEHMAETLTQLTTSILANSEGMHLQTILTSVAFIAIYVCIVAIMFGMLSFTAAKSRFRMCERIEHKLSCRIVRKRRKLLTELKNLENMQILPLPAYFPVLLCVGMVGAVVSFVYYKIGLVLAGLAVSGSQVPLMMDMIKRAALFSALKKSDNGDEEKHRKTFTRQRPKSIRASRNHYAGHRKHTS